VLVDEARLVDEAEAVAGATFERGCLVERQAELAEIMSSWPESSCASSAAVFSTVRMLMRRKAGAGPFQAALRSSVTPAPGCTPVMR
jgi:hypothetical protein